MTETHFQLIRGAGFIFAVLLAAGLQTAFRHAAIRGSWRTNGGLWVVDAVLLGVVCGGCACAVARWTEAEGIGLLHVFAVPLWASVPLTLLPLDAVSYFWHRANHVLHPLWRFHRVHHSDGAFTFSTGLRFHPGELLLSLPVRLVAVAILGPPIVAIAVFEVVFMVANLVEHGNIDLPEALERRIAAVVVTPALHRRHHTRQRPELDTNFGTIFTWWDRVFRTYRASSSRERIETGLPELTSPLALRKALLLPFRMVSDQRSS